MSFAPVFCSFLQKVCSKFAKSAILKGKRVPGSLAAPITIRKTRVETMKAFITVIGHDTVGVVARWPVCAPS